MHEVLVSMFLHTSSAVRVRKTLRLSSTLKKQNGIPPLKNSFPYLNAGVKIVDPDRETRV